MSQIREYTVRAQSTDTFGRVLCSARNHHFIVDGPAQNGCPGEAITPVEQFLSAVAACGVELVQVIAKEQGIDPPSVHVTIEGMIDRSRPAWKKHVAHFCSTERSLQPPGLHLVGHEAF